MPLRYHPAKAVAVAIGNAIPLVILPIALMRILPSFLPIELPLELQGLEKFIISIGSLAAVFAGLAAFYGKGLVWRAVFGSARQGTRVAWIYFVFSGGLISLDFGLFDFAEISFSLDFQRLLYILYAAILLMAVYFILEFVVYRETQRVEEYSEEYY
ncbi:MAG: hypothetical protein LN412_08480 [Candidatus Thermoplasmatota archaeon]|nr:hypothetical protein [Candidatus Thermoplasmatota archaeon]